MVAQHRLLSILFFTLLSGAGVGWSAAQAAQATAQLTLGDVIKLHQSGLSEEVIITRVRKNGKAFDLSPDELIELKKLGFSDNVIKYLLDPSLPYTPPPPPAPAAPARDSAPPPAPPPGPPPKQYPKDDYAAKVPPEPGLYWMQAARPAVKVDLKMLLAANEGPGLGKVLMKKGKVTGYLVGAAAKTRVAEATPVFYLRLPEGKGIEEIVLIALQQKNGRREIEMGPPGPKQEVKAEATRPFDAVEVGPRVFRLAAGKLAKGEYVFFLIGSAEPPKGSAGKGYDFGLGPGPR